MLLSAFISKRFRAYSGHKDEKNGFVSFIAKASTVGYFIGRCGFNSCAVGN